MSTIYIYIAIPLLSLFLMFVFTKPLSRLARKFNLVDKPNTRKVHKNSVPLVGGIAIALSVGLALLLAPDFLSTFSNQHRLLIGAVILLLMGIVDDKIEIRAIFKLIIQILLAYIVFDAGIKIESFFGILGIYEIPLLLQYLITLLVITGVVNAVNLMDGIDGLLAGFVIVGLSAFTYLAFIQGNTGLIFLYLAIIGALVGFLYFNLSSKHKVFMGDAGSLALGFILVVSGIELIQSAQNTGGLSLTLAIVIGILSLPVADSLRVYRKRIKSGYSPFRPDRTHFHHLVLDLGVKHQWASIIIIAVAIGILFWSVLFGSFFSLTISIMAILFIFSLVSIILSINYEKNIWLEKLQKLEKL